ncbi:hypothetical protein TREMEDRAFT_29308 [Tremella mesenterica DSM 1558]|uniref:uncharacterized protein n=1 Tax=Tremella mesenterica (strain ATCC 24925 / CBS 8224 / DSM 1558 / NBRC 9311 / NRRL Y-6157 / RJB 2259-6 / UBC 559-6) TaxID=578456 RepID=UPI0003F49773|nr:uncharacterized protein TREMEDRAFT_29308 [Tremella mesenterica DSM 1558]EIW70886.1 hypothetical protein TREMEDRAFT_29308 [Tremella mesenterica DSM 1558]
MSPSQPYAQPDPNIEAQSYGPLPDTAPFSQATEKTGTRFAPKKRLNDPIFLILFIAAVAGFAVVSGLAISSFISVNGLGGGFGSASSGQTGSSVTLDYHAAYLLLVVCCLGLFFAVIWLMIVRAFTKVILEITLVLTVLLNIGICICKLTPHYWSGAIIFLVIAILSVVYYWAMRRRIPFAKMLLQTTIDITKHHPSVYVVVLLGLILQTAWSFWYAFSVVAIYVKWTPGSAACTSTSCSSSKVAGLIVYQTFAFYWVSQVIANVVLCTLAGGIYGGWYYYGPRAGNLGLPKRATLKAFVRSITFSLGSIAFGSLIVTILEMLRLGLQALQQYEASEGDVIGQILACCAVCCVSIIDGLVQWFNKCKSFVSSHLYKYIPAAKDTWRLLRDRGIDAMVNDSLVGSVIMWGAYINGFLCALFGYIYLRYTDPSYNSSGQYSAPIILYSFLIGINMGYTIGSAIEAGVSTIFVGLGEDPMILAERSPGLFEMIRKSYPRVVQGVPS